MAILIISRKEGFRRAGMAHSTTPTVYPDTQFTPEQLALLRQEPMLIVQEVADEPEGIPPKPWDKMTVAELKAYAAEHSIDLGEATKRDDILAVIAESEKDVQE